MKTAVEKSMFWSEKRLGVRGRLVYLVNLSNRPHFLWVYRRDNPRGMLGEHEKSL